MLSETEIEGCRDLGAMSTPNTSTNLSFGRRNSGTGSNLHHNKSNCVFPNVSLPVFEVKDNRPKVVFSCFCGSYGHGGAGGVGSRSCPYLELGVLGT